MTTILVVEDNELNMKLFHDLLSAHGYEVLQAERGVVGLRLARERRPDLIVMDIQLPDMSGLEVTGRIKEDPALRHIPIMAVTAFAMRGDEDRIRQAGCDAYMAKPINVRAFLKSVENLLLEPVRSRVQPEREAGLS